jgi:hypothetical protein
MAILPGVGYLLANDILTDAAYVLIQSSVDTTVPLSGIAPGVQTVAVWDASMYIGAQILVGVIDGDLEVVTITATIPGTSFTATFANAHVGGEPIVGATFPVRQTTDPLFTQAEMIAYLSNATNDFMTDCPLVYEVNEALSVAPTQQTAALPSDLLFPVRMALNGYPLRETSQSNLDSMYPTWTQVAPSQPYAYFRDKTGLQKFGITPRANNSLTLELVYAQRGSETKELADGFLFPDCFTIYPKYRTLAFAFSKDGEARNPALAKYFQGRYDLGVKISNVFLKAIEDPNLQMAS